jgi:hypothetical protein
MAGFDHTFFDKVQRVKFSSFSFDGGLPKNNGNIRPHRIVAKNPGIAIAM